MEKLELKDIAPYLPYDVEYQFNISDVWKGVKDESRIQTLRYGNIPLCLKYGKPILKPLSDLTKDEEFIDFVNEQLICGAWRFEVNSMDMTYILTTEKNKTFLIQDDEISCECPLIFYQWMVENHYDINGLIPKNLAIDINTFK